MYFFLFLLTVSCEIILNEDFTNSEHFTLGSIGTLGTYYGRKALKVSLDKVGVGLVKYYKSFDNNISGKGIRFKVDIYADNVSQPEQSYNGIKFMYSYIKNGEKQYPQQGKVKWDSSNEWINECTIEISSNVDDEISDGKLNFGLQGSSGTVYFSNLVVEVFEPTNNIKYSIPKNFQ